MMNDSWLRIPRRLLQRPLFTFAIAVPLTLGFAAVILFSSLARDLFFDPLALPGAERLVVVEQDLPELGGELWLSPANYLELRDSIRSLAPLEAMELISFTLTQDGEPRRLSAAAVTPGFFELLQTFPAQGRPFPAESYQVERPATKILAYGRSVILSHDLWRNRFGSRDVVGETLELDGALHRVAGIMPPGFEFPEKVDVWVPLVFGGMAERDYGGFYLQVLGRRAEGAGLEEVDAELTTLARQMRDASEVNTNLSFPAVALESRVVEDIRAPLLAALVLSLLVLVGVLTNALYLVLARVVEREHELAVRLAMGGRRRSLFRLLFLEIGLITAVALAAGLVLSTLALEAVEAWLPVQLTGFEAGLDGLALVAILLLALLGVWICAGIAATRLSGQDMVRSLAGSQHGRGASAGRRSQRIQYALISAQVALAVILCYGTFLTMKTYSALSSEPLHIDADRVLTLDLMLSDPALQPPPARLQFVHQSLEELRSLPGAEAAAATLRLPVVDEGGGIWFTVPSASGGDGETERVADFHLATQEHFRTLGTPLLAGRSWSESPEQGAQEIVVSRELARQAFGSSRGAIGQSIVLTPWPDQQWEIVGVAADVKQGGLRSDPEPAVYVLYDVFPIDRVRLMVRAEGDPLTLAEAARRRVWDLAPNLAFDEVGVLSTRIEHTLDKERAAAWWVALFGVLGIVLSVAGIYGSTAYLVQQRAPEIGIRMALGALPQQVIRQVVRGGLLRITAGLAVGAALAILLSRYVESLVYGVETLDLPSLVVSFLLLLAAGLLATYLPARRARTVEPSELLR